MNTAFPAAPDQLDADALTALLGAEILGGVRVRSIAMSEIGEGQGFLGVVCRVEVDYDQPCSLPATLVAKFPSRSADTRQRAMEVDLYRRELGFYRELAPSLGLSVPRCWAARFVPETHDFVLLLDDVNPVDVADQVDGCSPEQAMATVTELAKLHAHWWDSAELDRLEWIPPFATSERIANLSSLAREGWPLLVQLGADTINPQHLALGDELCERVPEYLQRLDALPTTLLHGDVRLDNLLFRPDNPTPVIIDWQGLTKGPGPLDVGYFIAQSLTVTDRRRHLHDLVDHYTSELADHGVKQVPDSEVWDGLRLAGLFSLIVACSLPVLRPLDDGRVRALASVMLERSLTAVTDIETIT